MIVKVPKGFQTQNFSQMKEAKWPPVLLKAEVLPSNNSAESVRALGKIGTVLKCWQDMNIHDGFKQLI